MFRDQLPPIVTLLGQLWDVEDDLLRRFWSAVLRATWSEVQAWQTELLLYQTIGDPEALARTVCAPARLMRALELLVQECQLARRGASQIQEKILTLLDAQGAWK